ncbi:MAG: DUF2341 domain-containing protein [Candidatus Paceibacterota bacterium]
MILKNKKVFSYVFFFSILVFSFIYFSSAYAQNLGSGSITVDTTGLASQTTVTITVNGTDINTNSLPSKNITLTINPAPPPPTATISSPSPCVAPCSIIVSWTSTNVANPPNVIKIYKNGVFLWNQNANTSSSETDWNVPQGTYEYCVRAVNADNTETGNLACSTTTVSPSVTPIAVSLTANPTSMTLPTNATRLTWTTTGSPTSCVASNAWSGTKTASGGFEDRTGMTAGTYTFTITCSKAGTADAVSAVVVVVNAASAMSGTLTPSTTSCTIASGASSCNVSLSWTTTNPVGTSAVTSNYPVANTTVATGNSGTNISFSVPYLSSPRTFYLYNNSVLLAQSTATVSCTSGTSWNGSSCAPSSGPITPTCEDPTNSAWYSTGGIWGYRKIFQIDDAKVQSTQSSFPVLISLTTDANLQVNAQSDGDDILFTNSSGTKLDHEIEKYNSATGQLIAWVKVPSLLGSGLGDTQIYMYYGNSSATNQQNPTGVWDANYLAVWHFPNGTTLSALDSTSNGNNGAKIFAIAAAGYIGGGLNPNNGYVTGSNINLASSPLTVEAWQKPTDSYPTYGKTIFSLGSVAATDKALHLRSQTNTTVRFGLLNDDFDAAVSAQLNLWNFTAITMTASKSQNIYQNGSLASSRAAVGLFTGNTTWVIGDDAWSFNSKYAGTIDELRVSNIVRSANWIKTEYNNQSSPSTFYGTSVQCSLVVPTLTTTTPVTNITPTTATGGGNITSNGGATVTVSGLVWSTSTNPTTALSTKTTDGWAIGGPWTSGMTGLTASTLYYVRAYATNSAGTAYGANVTFTTSAAPVNGAPGSANGKIYPYGTSSYSPDTQCSAGTSSNTAFPAPGATVYWLCLGLNGGTDGGPYSASQTPPSVSINASPTTISTGGSTTLTWSSNALSCAGTNFNTSGAPSNSIGVVMSPASTTTYTVTCDGVSASVKVTVKIKPKFIED